MRTRPTAATALLASVVVVALSTTSCGRAADTAATTTRAATREGTPPTGGTVAGPDGSPIEVARDVPGLPADWPTDVAVPDGAGSLTVSDFASTAPTAGRSVTYVSTRPTDELVTFHRERLVADGWTIDAEVPTTTGAAISASKPGADGATRTTFVTVSDGPATTPDRSTVVLATSG